MKGYFALYFIPKIGERKKITPLRRALCEKYHNKRALMYPVHITLTLGVEITDFENLNNALRKYCKTHKSKKLQLLPTTTHNGNSEALSVINEPWLCKFQQGLQQIIDKHSKQKRKRNFTPHITLVYANTKILTIKSPLRSLSFTRITLVRKPQKIGCYSILKHYTLNA